MSEILALSFWITPFCRSQRKVFYFTNSRADFSHISQRRQRTKIRNKSVYNIGVEVRLYPTSHSPQTTSSYCPPLHPFPHTTKRRPTAIYAGNEVYEGNLCQYRYRRRRWKYTYLSNMFGVLVLPLHPSIDSAKTNTIPHQLLRHHSG